jgi:RNA-splicing ligase RtcB
MTEKPQDPSSDSPSDRPPLADQIRAKMDEYDVDRRLNELATTLEDALRQGVTKVGEFAHEHKSDLERLIDKAAGAVDRSTDGKHADKIQQVRGSLERGVDKIADQRHDGRSGPTGEPGPDVPPSNG